MIKCLKNCDNSEKINRSISEKSWETVGQCGVGQIRKARPVLLKVCAAFFYRKWSKLLNLQVGSELRMDVVLVVCDAFAKWLGYAENLQRKPVRYDVLGRG